ncbi:hypothetical protein DUT90_01975 [Polaribacter sp. WD7]|uniref:hypothetical protein n=1 Tax=Polaribacter sp. WD7 TaxID=2269061 RepID=UPI000DF40AD3|nr:hypothetical protein [Polaribacter sp. WD7]RCS28099.1 hypothetical protein DUT90_01975 [Polaribacter sp. WD7]
MALICRTSRTWITREVIEPVENWVNQRRRTCRTRRRWWQRLWCWFTTILVLIIVWVVRNIVVEILNTICVFITWVIGAILLPFAVAYDAIAGNSNVAGWVRDWFIEPTKISFVSKEDDPNKPKSFIYTFICNCDKTTFSVNASNDVEAQKLATNYCKPRC